MSTSPSMASSGARYAGLERRRHLRRRILIPATLDAASEKNAVVADISRSGLGVMVFPEADGNRLHLRFTLPESGALVRATGEVRWRDRTGRTGLRLLAIDCKPSDWHGWFDNPSGSVGKQIEWPKEVPARHTLLGLVSAVEKDFHAGRITAEAALQTVLTTTVDVMEYSGAAIVLKEGTQFMCRASAGVAPTVGAVLEPDATLSEQCLRTGKVLICTETRANPRFAGSFTRDAAILIPLRRSATVQGMFAVFAPSPDRIRDEHVSMLSDTGTVIEGILGRPAADKPVWETRELDHPAEVITPSRDKLSLPEPTKSSFPLLRWAGAAILVVAAVVGIIFGARPVLSAFLSARRSGTPSVSASPPAVVAATSNRDRKKTQILIVEGLAVPRFSTPGVPLKIEPGRLAHRTDLTFPEAAVKAGIDGDVKAALTISEKGSVEEVQVLQGDDLLANEVITTVGHWRYLPFKMEGKPVSVKLPITVSFVLRHFGDQPGKAERR